MVPSSQGPAAKVLVVPGALVAQTAPVKSAIFVAVAQSSCANVKLVVARNVNATTF